MLKILIVEDEALIALQIKNFLIRKGLQVAGYASNFVEAHRLFSEHRPEIIICDIHLQNDEKASRSLTNSLSWVNLR